MRGVQREGDEREAVRQMSDEARGWVMQPRKSGNGGGTKRASIRGG